MTPGPPLAVSERWNCTLLARNHTGAANRRLQQLCSYLRAAAILRHFCPITPPLRACSRQQRGHQVDLALLEAPNDQQQEQESTAEPNNASFNGWNFNTKQINILPVEEAQVEHVHGRSIILSALGRHSCQEGKVPSKPPSKIGWRAAKNCKADVWIVIFFSPEDQ